MSQSQLARSEMAILLDQWAAWVKHGGESQSYRQTYLQLDVSGPARPAPVIQNVTALMIDRAVAELPADRRAMLFDYCIHGLDVKAIAEKNKLNAQTCKARVLCTIDEIESRLGL